MANITPTLTKNLEGGVFNVYTATWVMGIADTGLPVAVTSAADRSVQIEGTIGGATIVIQGSNDGVNYQPLTDPQGNAISKTVASIEAISEVTRFVRPVTSGGAGSTITVTLLMRGQA